MNPGDCEPHQGDGESSLRSNRRPRKRRCNDQHEGAGDGPKYPESRLAKSPFECPFSKLSPHRFPECRGHRLMRPSDVMQHIKRQHYVRGATGREEDVIVYCPRCRHRFSGMGAASRLRAHSISESQCQVTNIEQSGVTLPSEREALQSTLERCKQERKSAMERWYAIWDTLFPEKDRPPSPHIEISVPRLEVQSIIENAVVSVNQNLSQKELKSIVTLSVDRIFEAPLDLRSRPCIPPQALPDSVQAAPASSRATHRPSVLAIASPSLQAQVPDFDDSFGLLNPGNDARPNAGHTTPLDDTLTTSSEVHTNSGSNFSYLDLLTVADSEASHAAATYFENLGDSFECVSQYDGFPNTYENDMGHHSSQD